METFIGVCAVSLAIFSLFVGTLMLLEKRPKNYYYTGHGESHADMKVSGCFLVVMGLFVVFVVYSVCASDKLSKERKYQESRMRHTSLLQKNSHI